MHKTDCAEKRHPATQTLSRSPLKFRAEDCFISWKLRHQHYTHLKSLPNPLNPVRSQPRVEEGRVGLYLESAPRHINSFPTKPFNLRGQNPCISQGPGMNIWTFVSQCVLGSFLSQASHPSGDLQTCGREPSVPTAVLSVGAS